MRTTLLIIAICFFGSQAISAQENKTVMEESVIKRVTVRNGSKVEVKEIKETVQEKGAVVVEGSEDENQAYSENIKKDESKEVLVDEVTDNAANQALVEELKLKREKELKDAIAAEKAAMAAERKIIEEKKKQQMAELEANRKRLQKRGKKMAKLKKGKKN